MLSTAAPALRKPKDAKAKAPEVPDESAAQVKRADLSRLNVLHDLLRVLNDPLAGAQQIALHVGRLPCLRARVTRRFAERLAGRSIPSLPEQVAALGNRPLEALLLELLEDLTELKAADAK
jgi:hypothetical protein